MVVRGGTGIVSNSVFAAIEDQRRITTRC